MTASGPTFMVIGAQKAASTSLLGSLREHPAVWMPTSEDPFLRDPLFDVAEVPTFVTRYAGHPETAVGLKCPDYLARPEVPARVAELLPGCRLIAILRNPVDRAISAYFWFVRWGVLPVEEPSTGLRRLLAGEFDDEPTAREILDWGLYHQHLEHWCAHVDPNQLLVLRDSELRRDPDAVLAAAFAHVGVDATFRAPVPLGERNEGIYPRPRLRFVRLRNRWILDRHPSGYWNIFPPSRPGPRMVSNAVAATDRYVLRRLYGNARPLVDPSVRDALTDFYRADSTSLEHRFGPNPPDWPGGAR